MSPQPITQNTLFYGDNLNILREYIATESVDLVSLDPPFNSSRNYNVLFKDESGVDSESQITAFEDTWHWNQREAFTCTVTLRLAIISKSFSIRFLEYKTSKTKLRGNVPLVIMMHDASMLDAISKVGSSALPVLSCTVGIDRISGRLE